jgi:hypothetical protein
MTARFERVSSESSHAKNPKNSRIRPRDYSPPEDEQMTIWNDAAKRSVDRKVRFTPAFDRKLQRDAHKANTPHLTYLYRLIEKADRAGLVDELIQELRIERGDRDGMESHHQAISGDGRAA